MKKRKKKKEQNTNQTMIYSAAYTPMQMIHVIINIKYDLIQVDHLLYSSGSSAPVASIPSIHMPTTA